MVQPLLLVIADKLLLSRCFIATRNQEPAWVSARKPTRVPFAVTVVH